MATDTETSLKRFQTMAEPKSKKNAIDENHEYLAALEAIE